MRVIHILRKLDPAEWGGTETALQRLCDGLRDQGVTSLVYCPRLPACASGDHNRTDPLEEAGHSVERFNAFVPVLGVSRERRRQMLSVGGNLMSFDLISALMLAKADVVHTHTLGRLGGIALTVARQKRAPFVVTIHGGVLDLPAQLKKDFNAPADSGWEWGKFFGLLFQSHRLFVDADAIVTCNEKEAALLREKHPEKRIVVQPHGVPVSLYQADHRQAALAAFPQLAAKPFLLNLGRVDPVKNQGWLIDQAGEMLRRHPDALLVFAGPCTDEAYDADLRRRIHSRGLEGRVLFTGGFPPNDPRLIGLLQLATVTVLCSVSETFGLILLEAWAAGAVVLASATSGAKALVRPGENGFLFQLEEPAGFHEALDRLMGDEPARREMAREGLALVQRDYSVHALAYRMQQVYAELLEEKHALRHNSR